MNVARQLKGMAFDLVDRVVPVKPVVHAPDLQTVLDRESRRMHLYFSRNCPASIQVRRHCLRLGLRVVEKDVERVDAYRNELVNGGGIPRVPCLRIDGEQNSEWLYSPDAIHGYLNRRY
ncbi:MULTISPECIES: glutaredoxin domain-containing protein [unclassified Oceanobacter]|uniref:glutaredoxin family protein n=2 Tax=Gammaproteobacteria TaxID=1236 RepID=UPI0026E3913F|nr:MULTISPECIES: glutaredoxin domain-containing protein [unclassified Oceanobacter]MDO6682407.1 glutaredoxin domain-containing protein [Oceanobacter sp. 5_MG-2023]MDP2505951.1 glutaredoxin domain-containing protein [Oceanobacter sp. 3_MG-2023]MDP2547536.1 glutaredoxin domain-containing protein [Oceanobacter sp. 4_MG-2023]MDP2608910.1 glutaredoxin domain-containing protein [Oceanobacter sp. 1_MG-2023]MDP2612105.1 glutaredoxin domain-containing protein [Oceanobacter sp. 2_MG-2023]